MSSARRVLTAAAACGLLAHRAAAQQPAPPPVGRIVLGAGVDARLRDGADATPALTLHAGYERRVGASRLGLRLAADYFAQHRGDYVVRGNDGMPVERIENSSDTHVYGAGLLATYGLAATPVRPYLIGGVGVSRLAYDRDRTAEALGGPLHVARTSAALSGGLGLDARVGRLGVFAEGRFTYLPNGSGGREPGVRGYVIPLTLGVRF
ncbi:MAG: outer membrane beta-barrel protein [Gemmatimonadaceae bacterium]